jgi:hypothetical protein
MHRTKCTARRSRIVAASSSNNENDISLGACQEEASAQRNQFTRKYEAQWKDDLSM